MIRILASSLLALSISAGAAMAQQANCDAPGNSPSVPDGKTANHEQMVEGSQAVQSFQAETQSYLDCLDEHDKGLQEAQAAAEKQDKQRILKERETMRKSYNDAVDNLHAVAGSFNQSIKDFRAREDE